jgi:hypothetical protein
MGSRTSGCGGLFPPCINEIVYRCTSHQIRIFPHKVIDTKKKTAATSRNLARRTTRTAKSATAAHDTTIKPILSNTISESGEYFPENHLNAQYQSQPTPMATKHRTSHEGCIAFTLFWPSTI